MTVNVPNLMTLHLSGRLKNYHRLSPQKITKPWIHILEQITYFDKCGEQGLDLETQGEDSQYLLEPYVTVYTKYLLRHQTFLLGD